VEKSKTQYQSIDPSSPREKGGSILSVFSWRRHGLELAIILFLMVSTLVVYWPVRNHEFIHYDDLTYGTLKRILDRGLDHVQAAPPTTRPAEAPLPLFARPVTDFFPPTGGSPCN